MLNLLDGLQFRLENVQIDTILLQGFFGHAIAEKLLRASDVVRFASPDPIHVAKRPIRESHDAREGLDNVPTVGHVSAVLSKAELREDQGREGVSPAPSRDGAAILADVFELTKRLHLISQDDQFFHEQLLLSTDVARLARHGGEALAM